MDVIVEPNKFFNPYKNIEFFGKMIYILKPNIFNAVLKFLAVLYILLMYVKLSFMVHGHRSNF